jgi:UDP-N-acetylmuramate--alanine ligase
VVVTDVYGAGEDPVPGVSGRLIVEALADASPETPARYVAHRSEAAALVAEEMRAGDLVLTLGAGDITTLADEVRERVAGRRP